jgi:hypothetical protein
MIAVAFQELSGKRHQWRDRQSSSRHEAVVIRPAMLYNSTLELFDF